MNMTFRSIVVLLFVGACTQSLNDTIAVTTTTSQVQETTTIYTQNENIITNSSISLATLDNVWKCISPITAYDYQDNTSKICFVEIEVAEDVIKVISTGIPSRDFKSWYGCCASEQNKTWYLPLYPELSNAGINDVWTFSQTNSVPIRGAIAITVEGVAIYGPEDGPGSDAVATDLGIIEETEQRIELDFCGGHRGPGGEYHYHYDANCIHWHSDTENDIDYTFQKILSSIHSKIVGFAFDGYAIYGSYGFDQNNEVKEMKSSYALDGEATGSNGILDYIYIEQLGDLDQCNGHVGYIPESSEAVYHYHSTINNGEGNLGFPYFLYCYRGNPLFEYGGVQVNGGSNALANPGGNKPPGRNP